MQAHILLYINIIMYWKAIIAVTCINTIILTEDSNLTATNNLNKRGYDQSRLAKISFHALFSSLLNEVWLE